MLHVQHGVTSSRLAPARQHKHRRRCRAQALHRARFGPPDDQPEQQQLFTFFTADGLLSFPPYRPGAAPQVGLQQPLAVFNVGTEVRLETASMRAEAAASGNAAANSGGAGSLRSCNLLGGCNKWHGPSPQVACIRLLPLTGTHCYGFCSIQSNSYVIIDTVSGMPAGAGG